MNTMRWNVLCAFAIRYKKETNGHLLELTRVVKHMNEIGVEMIKCEFGSICLLWSCKFNKRDLLKLS